MSAGAVACSSCGYENVVAGCGFCLQCGIEFPVSAATDNEPIAQDSRQAQSTAFDETIVPVATSADAGLVAPVTQANSQHSEFFDHKGPAGNTLEDESFDTPIPCGETQAFQSDLLAAQENDNFFAEATESSEESIGTAVEVDEQPNEWRATDAADMQPECIAESVDQAAVSPTGNTLEDESFAPPIPCGETQAFQSDLLAAQENDSFFAEATESSEESIGTAVDDEQPDDWRATDAADTKPEDIAESSGTAVERTESLLAPTQSDASFDSTDATDESVDETAWPAAESNDEPENETAWPAAESNDEPEDETDWPQSKSAESEMTQVESAVAASVEEERTETGAESASDDRSESEFDEAESVEQTRFSDALSLELDRLIMATAKSVDMEMNVAEKGMVGELEFEGRKQHVYVQRNYNSNGVPLLSFFATCGPASQQHAFPLLEWNSALPMCAFAIREIENTQMFVVQANVPAFSCNQMTIAATFKEIAKRADQVQQRIG